MNVKTEDIMNNWIKHCIHYLSIIYFALNHICSIDAINHGSCYLSENAFAALHNNGSVTAWGDSSNGGSLPIGGVTNVSIIYGQTYTRSFSSYPHIYGGATEGIGSFPTPLPTSQPTSPSSQPSGQPSSQPTLPTSQPSSQPSLPTGQPSSSPTITPAPTSIPSNGPTAMPSTLNPSSMPSMIPTSRPSSHPTLKPTSYPSFIPSSIPTASPTIEPTLAPVTFYWTKTRIGLWSGGTAALIILIYSIYRLRKYGNSAHFRLKNSGKVLDEHTLLDNHAYLVKMTRDINIKESKIKSKRKKGNRNENLTAKSRHNRISQRKVEAVLPATSTTTTTTSSNSGSNVNNNNNNNNDNNNDTAAD